MVKYYYDKYSSIRLYEMYVSVSNGLLTNGGSHMEGSRTYTFDKYTGKFALGTKSTYPASRVEPVYVNNFPDILGEYYSAQSGARDAWDYIQYKSRLSETYERGTLIQSNIEAENGTYPANGRHTDGYWYVRKTVVNQNPVITPSTVPSGSMAVKPAFNYRVSDPDNDSLTVTESIDGIVFNTRTGVVSGAQLTFTPTDLAWLRTRIKQTVNITIKADDGRGGVTTVNYPITRTTPAIDLQLKTPFSTDIPARRLLLRLEGNIPVDAIVSVQACNNAFDTTPTWENATNMVLSGFPFPFTNKTKTATKWGVSFKVRVERGSSVQPIYIDGLGGAFD